MTIFRFFPTLTIPFTFFLFFIGTGPLFAQAPKQKIAIIGGGITGVAAATLLDFALSENVEIHLFEANPVLGGNAGLSPVDNGQGEKVTVDTGPQFFDLVSSWKIYPELLKAAGIFDASELSYVDGSILIYKRNGQGGLNLVYRSPTPTAAYALWAAAHPLQTAATNTAFLRFYTSAQRLIKNKDLNYDPSLKEWIGRLNIRKKYKEEIILPFISASIGTDIQRAQEYSAKAILKLFAFQPAVSRHRFYLMKGGLGRKIQQLAARLETETKNLSVHLNSRVLSLKKTSLPQEGLQLTTSSGKGEGMIFDKVIFATHPDAAMKIIFKGSEGQNDIGLASSIYDSLSFLSSQYFKTTVYLHHDKESTHGDKTAFYNILLDGEDQKFNITMNLGEIRGENFGDIQKTWILNKEMDEKITSSGKLLSAHYFQHPLMTPKFIKVTAALRQDLVNSPVKIIGAWAMGASESHYTGIKAAAKAVMELFPEKAEVIYSKIPTLRKGF